MPAACTQKRIALAMFFPTPSVIIAPSSSAKALGEPVSAAYPFGSQVYRQGNVSWPEKRAPMIARLLVAAAAADIRPRTKREMTPKNLVCQKSGVTILWGARTDAAPGW